MKTSTLLCIFVNFCALLINLANLKPVPDLEAYPGGCVHSEQTPSLRARRSIQDMDAVNPAYLQTDSEPQAPNQGELSDSAKENYISSFALSEPMSEFFRSHKGREMQKPPIVKQEPRDHSGNLVEDVMLEGGEVLPSDEQIECYKQQNLWPPEPQKPLLRLKDQRPFSNVIQNKPNKQRMLSRPLIYKEKGTKRKDREEDADIITSLYSDPEKREKISKEKAMNAEPRNYNILGQPSQRTVNKPVAVRPEFPVYDEDIDFHPDPLQGILEEKYWLDPQEQEAVIRKYIDLAGNMQPPKVDHTKRNAPEEHVPKSVDSKEAFRNAEVVEKDCPCREIAACGDCSRGKFKHKSNFSEINEDGSLYGTYENRKLLSVNYDDNEESDGDSADKGYILQDKNDELEKYSSENYGVLVGNEEEESQVEGEVPSFTSLYFGRKLLSFEDDENTDEDYGEDEDSEVTEESPLLNLKSGSSDEYGKVARKIENRRSVGSDDGVKIENKTPNEKHYYSPIILKPSNSGVYEYKFETEKIGNENKFDKPNPAEEFMQMQKPFMSHPHYMAKYYVPNKLGNLLQKAIIKQKPKEKSTTIDPNREFEIERNKTFLNVSIAMNDINISDVTTETPELVKYNKRREQPIFLGVKGRRSYQLPLIKHPNVKTLHGTDESGSINMQNGNNTVNASSSTNTSLPTTIYSNVTGENVTDLNKNSTTDTSTASTTEITTTVNTTENGTTLFSTTAKPKKKIENYDEDSFDAEIANDIVETVIAESQSGSVVGHNLGLCRRNESISKYAKVSPESEQLLKKVTECILDRIRDRLEGQSCTLLDDELLQFLKWMVLSGESYKDYLARIKPEFREFKYEVHEEGPGPSPSSNADKQVQIPVPPNQSS